MEKAYLIENGIQTEVSLTAFERRIAGLRRDTDSWPEIVCVACGGAVFSSGLRTPNPEYTPRFSHKKEEGESCPLGKNSRRFNALSNTDYDYESAKALRAAFYEFSHLREAYIICRSLRGGKGMLSQADFIQLVNVADSFNIWRYKGISLWGATILLMLMANHPTRAGRASFFYSLKKKRGCSDIWKGIKLKAHWVSTGNEIQQDSSRNATFLHEIPFEEKTCSNILSESNNDWFDENTLREIAILSRKKSGGF